MRSPTFQADADGFADPTTLMTATADDKELVRATKAMGATWVAKVRSSSFYAGDLLRDVVTGHQIKKQFLDRAKAVELSNDDEMDEQPVCPKCEDCASHILSYVALTHVPLVLFEGNGRVLTCGHALCRGA